MSKAIAESEIVSFPVHDVERIGRNFDTVTTLEALTELLAEGQPIEDCSGRLEQVIQYFKWDSGREWPANALLGAIHVAFANHLPLILTPDVVWITIVQGVARMQHVEDILAGRQKTVIEHLVYDDFGGPETRWEALVGEFVSAIIQKEGDTAKEYLCNFSTTGERERMASGIAMMHAFSARYVYHARCICGIPTVTLEGNPSDWQKLLDKAEKMMPVGAWKDKVVPVLDQFARSANGDVDRQFWKDIYKLETDYGVEFANGWATYFFPYLDLGDYVKESEEGYGKYRITNSKSIKNPMVWGWNDKEYRPMRTIRVECEEYTGKVMSDKGRSYNFREERVPVNGVYSSHFPNGLCSAKVSVRNKDDSPRFDVEITGGLVGIKQDEKTLALKPVAGWAVRKA